MSHDYGGPNFIRSSNKNNLVVDVEPIIPLQFGIRDLWGKLQFGRTRIKCIAVNTNELSLWWLIWPIQTNAENLKND